ncbi:MAG: MBL fold metallo-hydrolase [Candidatus Thorarchaeota archaeon]|nr:MBL fold metallo-hydrolase [Candidatus Thorarchaeota archaeon]
MTVNSHYRDIEVKKVSSRVVIAQYKDYYQLNAAAIIMNNQIVVIDTLYYPSQGLFFRKLVEEEFGLPVKFLFLTHYHCDHVFGMSSFNDTTVIGSNDLFVNIKQRLKTRWTKEYFENWMKSEPPIADEIRKISIRCPDIAFEGEYILNDEDLILKFFHSGGHTSCSAFAYFPDERVLFTGDEIIAHAWPFIFDTTLNPDRYIDSLKSMLKLDVEFVVAGHGPVVGLNHVKEYLEHLMNLKRCIISGISEGKSPDSIDVPKFYTPHTDWQISEAKRIMYSYYSNHH